VRNRPMRRLSSSQELDLRPILEGIEASGLADIRQAVAAKDATAFEPSYRQMMSQCLGCHVAAEKPFLRPRIPQTPATHMIDLQAIP